MDEHPGDQADLVIHSFVIRIWLEDAGQPASPPIWHGQLTHIPGGERHYFSDLSEIAAIIKRHLDSAGNPMSLASVVP